MNLLRLTVVLLITSLAACSARQMPAPRLSPPATTVAPATSLPEPPADPATSQPGMTPTATRALTATTTPASAAPAAATGPPGPTPTAAGAAARSAVDATPVANATGARVAAPSATSTAPSRPAALPTASDGRYPKPAERGFTITMVANSAEEPFEHVTGLAWGPDGAMYVARMEGPIIRVAPDGGRTTLADGFCVPLGLAFRPGTDQLFVSHRGGITVVQDTNADGVAERREPFLTGLPCCYADLHQTNGIQFGPDGWLYVAQGSTSDHGEVAPEPWHAGILRLHPDRGSESLEYVATGLRNPYDLAITPEGRIFATDNGADYGPPEELNHVLPGADYGWPSCVTESPGQVAVHPVWNDPARCEGTRAGIATFVPHASANGITTYW